VNLSCLQGRNFGREALSEPFGVSGD